MIHFVKRDDEKENAENLKMCKKFGCKYILIDEDYKVDIEL